MAVSNSIQIKTKLPPDGSLTKLLHIGAILAASTFSAYGAHVAPAGENSAMKIDTMAVFQPAKAAAQGRNGMVSSGHHLASKIGAAILQDGGNAIDAAVAVGYAMAVTVPGAGNIGGGGFMTVRMANGT